MPLALVQKTGVGSSHRSDQQIQLGVSVKIGKHRARRSLTEASYTGRISDVGESPVAKVSEQCVSSTQIAQVNITESIAVVITQSHARAVQQVRVGHDPLVGERICKIHAGR